MKVALIILAVLATALAFPQAETYDQEKQKQLEFHTCHGKCSEEERQRKYVCYDDGIDGYKYRCDFKCNNKAYSNGELKETECKPGGYPYCEENECPPEELDDQHDRPLCVEGNWRDFLSICEAKCATGHYKKDVTFVPCEF